MKTRSDIIGAITAASAQLCYPATVTEETEITGLANDFDSLDYIELMMTIEEHLDFMLDDLNAAPDLETATVGDLATWIEGEVQKAGV